MAAQQQQQPNRKPMDRRVHEALEVRRRLRLLGAEHAGTASLLDGSRRLASATNAFVRDGHGCVLRMRLTDAAVAVVTLAASPLAPSGVALELAR